MDVSISGRHVDITDAMRDHAGARVKRLERHGPPLTRLIATLTIEGERHTAEIIATVKRHGDVVAKSETHDMYRSIDEAIDKVDRQLRKLMGRIRERRDVGREKWAASEQPAASEDDLDDDFDDEFEADDIGDDIEERP